MKITKQDLKQMIKQQLNNQQTTKIYVQNYP